MAPLVVKFADPPKSAMMPGMGGMMGGVFGARGGVIRPPQPGAAAQAQDNRLFVGSLPKTADEAELQVCTCVCVCVCVCTCICVC